VGHPTKSRRVHQHLLTMATLKQQAALYKEGRLELAIQAFKNGLF